MPPRRRTREQAARVVRDELLGVFPDRLWAAAEAADIFTVDELHDRLDVARGTAYAWTHGTSLPSLEATVHIARVLGVTVAYLVGESDDGRVPRKLRAPPRRRSP